MTADEANDFAANEARALYLDLLIRTLANTIYDDPNIDHWHEHVFHADWREEGRDWPREAHTMVGLRRLQNLRTLTETVLVEGIPGDLIETGVWRGGCCILMRGVLAAYQDRKRKVYVADSFCGLPPPSDCYAADQGDSLWNFNELAISRGQVSDNFMHYGLLDEQVVFLEGLFQETLPRLTNECFALIRLDGDMYESTIVALENLYPRLTPGGLVIIDDYGAIEACRRAATDYRVRHGIDAKIHEIDWTGIWWRKPSTNPND